MARKLRNPKARTDKLDARELWELVTGFSVSPDEFFASEEEMIDLFLEHRTEVEAWRDRCRPGEGVWIQTVMEKQNAKENASR